MNKKAYDIKFSNFKVALSVFTFLCLIIGYTYAYGSFRFSSSTNVSNVEATIGARPIFISSAGDDISLSVQVAADAGAGIGTGAVLATSNSEVNISLSNNYTTGSTCTYKLYWKWISGTGYDNYTKTTGTDNEITVTGTIDNNNAPAFSDISIPSYTSSDVKTLIYSGTISNTGGNIANQKINVVTNFYKTAASQSAHKGKNYVAKLVIDDVSCAKAV